MHFAYIMDLIVQVGVKEDDDVVVRLESVKYYKGS